MAACATTPQAGFSPEDLYPKELRACAAEPAVPPRPAPAQPRSEDAQTNYVKDLKLAGADCRDTVESWDERARKYEEQFKTMNAGAAERFWSKITGKKK